IYRVDFYEGAVSADNVVFSLEPTSVPYSFTVGDFVDPSGWNLNPLPADRHYQIAAIEHQFTDPDGEECQHNVAISVVAVAR
ncbi:MAG TPA: hypothetical protein VJQ55_16445, partial [Candidatus Binatia bacterium]|nr:hypothetical protein [Candidatus Binatia bacterium]